jgi:hypothetical protein
MTLEGRGKFVNRKTKTANIDYGRFFLYLPVEVAGDSSLPFKPNEFVVVRIDISQNLSLVLVRPKPSLAISILRILS